MFELPNGWATSSIGDLCSLINGRAFKPSEWTEAGLPIIRIQNLNRPNASFNYYNGDVDEKHLINDGDLLFAWSGTPGTSFGAHIWRRGEAVLNQHIFKVIFNDTLIDRYFFMNAINQTLEEQIAKAHGGVGLRHVTKGKFEETIISLPPLAEQKRIIAKLDTLSTKTVRAHTALARTEILLANYGEAIINAAFSGELTKAWRRRNGDVAEWVFHSLDQIVSDGPSNGWSPKAGGSLSGLKSLKLSATSSGRLRLDASTIKYIDQELPSDSKFWLRPNDILIQRANSLELLGTTVLFDGPANEYIFPDLMMRIRVNATKVAPKYLAMYLNSDLARAYFRSNATGTAGNMPKINGSIVRATHVPIPALEEQHEIVRLVEAAFAKIESLAEEVKRALLQLEKLEGALLAKAFRGELVPQVEGDEPASVVLERIRAERARLPKLKSRVSKRKTVMPTATEFLNAKLESWPDDGVSFQDLKQEFSGTYDDLKDAVFALLSDEEPRLVQVFHEKNSVMTFRKRP